MPSVQKYFEELVAEGDALLEELGDEGEAYRKGLNRRYGRWEKNVVEVLRYAKLESHLSDVKSVFNTGWTEKSKIEHALAAVESAVDLLERGFVGNLKILVHAELLATTVEEARTLFEAGHGIPAAVLARIVLEGWLRDEAEKAGLELSDKARPAHINEALKGAGIFSVPKWRQVQAYLDIGNAAAHGKVDELTPGAIGRLLAFAEAIYA